jgi:outer membrane protein OmpA-like peptidoglycan-associated protein
MAPAVSTQPPIHRGAVVAALALALTACSSNESLFVLVPDADGEVGSIEVSNDRGSVTLTEPGQTAEVRGAGSRVKVADEAMSDAEIRRIFGSALAVEPQPPRVFTIYFASDSAALDPGAVEVLDEVLDEIAGRDSLDVSVNGHSDRSGESEHNRRLSLERAEAVRNRLIGEGVDAELIDVAYHGEGDPVVPTEDGVAEPRNRRVEVIVR